MQHEQSTAGEETLSKISLGPIPASILSDRQLSQTAKFVFGLVASFALNDRNCFMTNARLATAVGVEVRAVQYAIRELVDRGHLLSELREGCRFLIAQLGVEMRADPDAKNCMGGDAKNCMPPMQKIAPIQYKYSTSTSKEVEGEGAPPKVLYRIQKERIKLTDKQYQSLVEEFSPDALTYYIEFCNNWCLANGKQKKDHTAFLRNWIRKDIAEQSGFYKRKFQSYEKPKTIAEKNKAFFDSVLGKENDDDIRANNDAIEVNFKPLAESLSR